MESLRPAVCAASAGAGEPAPIRRKPKGLVLDLRTAADLGRKENDSNRFWALHFCLFSLKLPRNMPWSIFLKTFNSHMAQV